MLYPVSAFKAVRILRDPKSNDGWIAKTRTGKVCFIENIDEMIPNLVAGQLWQAAVVKVLPKYELIVLTTQLAS